jgi:hypothetical protein
MEPLADSPRTVRQHRDLEFHARLSKRNASDRHLLSHRNARTLSEPSAGEVAAGGEFFRGRSHLEEKCNGVELREIQIARCMMDEITISALAAGVLQTVFAQQRVRH